MDLRGARILIPAVLLLVACGAAREPESADLLLLGARVYTLSWPEPAPDGTPAADAPRDEEGWHPDAEAVAVRDGRILFVGSAAEAERFRGPRTRVEDLGGATVIPGLVDSHTHVETLGTNLERVDLEGVATEEEVLARLRAQRPNVEEGRWIVGWGWDEGAWASRYPDMTALSEAFPRNPVVLLSLHGFATWGNRAAFEAAGIDAATEPPVGGEIVRDARGRPTGILLNRAGILLRDALPAPSPEERLARFRRGLEEMASSGYVAVHEAGVDSGALAALERLEQRGELRLRVYAMLSARDEELMRAWIGRGPDRETGSRLRVRSVKAFYDGALGSRGARLLEDYADRPGHRGTSGEGYGFDEGLVEEALGAGFQVAIHAIGDAGNRETLDFFARTLAEHPAARSLRHRIEHAQVVHPEDVPRLAALGLVASMQPPHAVEDKAWAEDRLGPERVRWAYAWRTLRQAGVDLIFNSDLAGSDHDIFYGLHAAVTRRDRKLQPDAGWYPEESLSIEEALRAYTVWAVRASFLEEETGVLEPGKWADLTVLDLDPFVVAEEEPDRLLEGRVLMTVARGELLFDGRTP